VRKKNLLIGREKINLNMLVQLRTPRVSKSLCDDRGDDLPRGPGEGDLRADANFRLRKSLSPTRLKSASECWPSCKQAVKSSMFFTFKACKAARVTVSAAPQASSKSRRLRSSSNATASLLLPLLLWLVALFPAPLVAPGSLFLAFLGGRL
jgi:hypothetical protein